MNSEARDEVDMVTKVAPDNDNATEKTGNAPQETVPYAKLFTYADNFDKLLMVIGTIGSMCNGSAWPMFALIFGDFTNTFGNPSAPDFMSKVSQIALYFVYLAIAALVAAYFQASFWMWTGNRQTAKLRQAYLSAVLRQDISYFDTQTSTGGLLQGLNDDSASVQQAISEKVGHFTQHMTTFVVGYIVAFSRGWDMTLVMLGTLPFLAAVGATLSKLTTMTAAKTEASYTKASSMAQQSISQIRTVAAYNGEEVSLKKYEDFLVYPLKVGIQQSIVSGVCNGAVFGIVFYTYAVAFIYGAWRVSTGNYTGGNVMSVLVAALLGGFSAGQAAPVMATFATGRMAGSRLFKVIERVPTIDVDNEEGDKPDVKEVKGQLELRDVYFSYPARLDTQVFRGFNLMVPAGKTVALVGSSGSGKSTAVQLIERFYDPEKGVVLLDGMDLRSLNLKWLRSQIGLVSQEPTLFATTIFENIRMGKPEASDEEVHQAAASANALRFINNLPLKFNTEVGERGLSLSGGQKQRIAIARAILKNPKIMLLDEATSALDTESERIVQDALNRMIVGRTTVVVAHRLSTIKDADHIVVVSEGQVAEQGSHAKLLEDPIGKYTTLVKLQMQEEGNKGGEAKKGGDSKSSDWSSAGDVEEVEESVDPDAVVSVPVPAVEEGGVKGGSRKGSLELRPFKKISLFKDASVTVDVEAGKGGLKGQVEGEKGEVEKKEEAEEANVPFSRLLMLNKPEWPHLAFGTLGAGAAGAVQPSFAFLLSTMISTFYNTAPSDIVSSASFLCWMFFAMGCGNLIAAFIMYWMFGVAGHRLAYRIRLQLYRAMLFSEIGWFDMPENASGILTTRLATDAVMIRGAVGDTIAVMIQNCVSMAYGLIIAFVYNWRMALLMLGALPFMISGSIIYYNNIRGLEQGTDKMFSGANQAVSDAVSSVRVVHAYNLKDQVCGLYVRMLSGTVKSLEKQSHVTGAMMGYSQFSLFSVYGLIIWFGGWLINAGLSDFTQMLVAFLAILLAAMGLAQSAAGFPDLGKAKTAIAHVFPIIDRKSKINVSDGKGIMPANLQGAIELQNVRFTYPARPSVVVFNNFNLSIPAGNTVALVGESGSGKSTIVGLIERFYDVDEGNVLLDGVNIKDYNLKWLRKHVGLVSQEPLLFSMSIIDNIRYGAPEATLEQVEAAAKAANAYDFIMKLPEGFDTLVGERGMQLSGGQKQRVAIARAVIKDPRIMLLDEATSALDARAEREVQEALDQIMVGRTSVVVAHRLSTIRNADLIALVFRGSILEQGNHDQLMAIPDGGYARLVAAQNGAKR